jgi:uncharacterized membrane protein YgdD (TMEM256/DUF423 family)
MAAVGGFLAVAIGASGAHILEGLPRQRLEWLEIGLKYHFYHVLALPAAAWASSRWPRCRAFHGAGWAWIVGIVLFSGSLYAMAYGGMRVLGMVTPVGGTALMLGWLFLGIGVLRAGRG